MKFELARSRRAWFSSTKILVMRKRKTPCGSSGGLLKYFRTVESRRSASEESSDCQLPNVTSGTEQQLNFSAESGSVVASVVH